ncbi:LysE family translocator [Tsukamurella tyrosinosolvens]|uniref:LysE family translocator n=1 Tax=Tsukamurella tyrosinosolvens TaxID=57704 RepID=UPI000798C15B|nr:LysE family translocator [Tsukamurella tyrosinosolvens]AUN40682.1 lysine transporter LysE [Tsukamurella tyrosinosolvens]KXP06123.1 lysine transporter LysE [Tsukamurella tyrosinosolvens]KZL95955.1 lysine transporter LysE [Tsukamurella tyrosinosolvens]MCA4993224.1 LysE family translocator [Tsukamurella tyrosinosolvens]WEL93451.1 LysE family translocator [Tsukamurella tyrosinosolvens]
MLVALLSFAAASTLLVVLPGPDTLVVVRGVVQGGRGAGLRTSLGVLSGLVVWVVAAVLGLSAMLKASEYGYTALKVLGAAYLISMGVQSLRAVVRGSALGDEPAPPVESSWRTGGFTAGFLTDMLNPKIGVLFVSLLPGFVPSGYSVTWTTLALGGVYIALTAVYCGVLIAAAGTVTRWMRTPRTRRMLDGVAGVALIGFGAKLVTER